MREQLRLLKEKAEKELLQCNILDDLNEFRIKYMGKKGELTQILRGMGKLPATERPLMGQLANEIRDNLETRLAALTEKMKRKEIERSLFAESIDVTLPGIRPELGRQHPLSLVIEEIEEIFMGMGFTIEEGPEIELDYYNFEALNIPKDHPAREMQDSFYISPEVLLRTHTSPVQARTMEKMRPHLPIKIIVPGKVYRRDDDATHSPMFHQVEGLLIDQIVRFSDLKGVLLNFAQQMFGADQKIRLRPSFFPFTEPSAEVDISCVMCKGAGCRTCSQTGWLEVLGAGMVHPRVLEMGGYNPEEVSGFAFGMGVERIAMLKYGIDDLRLLFENDVRFLRQF
ncbi:MAG: phenylalanine--tRNA ligase subunit alpha [Clostridia bacterium]|nr:phenylalanine--tRNA ligase subunit alpha [Clostridia bacterium]MDD4145954.1 phenylalanine--tRNA ligase subunit alpha [Clostridia bacterium]MDD4665666.1 phenylalanine--tRNA ligase subunit alpha [Clostridia bacterium]